LTRYTFSNVQGLYAFILFIDSLIQAQSMGEAVMVSHPCTCFDIIIMGVRFLYYGLCTFQDP